MNGGSILVTGGAGYIGARTCKALKLAGFLAATLRGLDLSIGPMKPLGVR